MGVQSTFRLKFRLDDLGEIHLDIRWVEGKETKTIPPEHWPVDSDDMESVQKALFPYWHLKMKAAKARAKVAKNKLKRAIAKLTPKERRVKVKSRDTGKIYIITSIANEKGRKIKCTCEDFIWRRKNIGSHCKHITAWLKSKGQLKPKDTTLPDTKKIRKLWYRVKRTLRTYDCDEFLEEEFAEGIKNDCCRLDFKTSRN
jgi:hypothetical protein